MKLCYGYGIPPAKEEFSDYAICYADLSTELLSVSLSE